MKRFVILMIFLIPAILLLYRQFDGVKEPQTVVVSEALQELVLPESVQAGEVDNEVVEPAAEDDVVGSVEKVAPSINEGNDLKVIIPATELIDAPFVVQAPFADWSELYKEACEEASVVIVDQFYQGTTEMTQDEMKQAVDELLSWGMDTFGTYDTTAEQTAQFFTDYYSYDSSRVSVIYDMTIEDIKAVLSKGYPVIVPAAGRDLGNKYFRQPGPLYHMLVIVGYDDDEFITNDPGTRRGEGYRYKQEVLYNAIHDLTDPLEDISSGRKAMIVVR